MEFILGTDGKVQSAKCCVVSVADDDEKVLNAVLRMPAWNPAKQRECGSATAHDHPLHLQDFIVELGFLMVVIRPGALPGFLSEYKQHYAAQDRKQ